MARRSSRSRNGSPVLAYGKRDDLLTSLARPVAAFLSAVPGFELTDIEDGRLWNPDPDPGAVTVGGRWARVVVHSRPMIARSKPIYAWKGLPVGVQPPVGLKFESPLKVVTCVRRKVRREVIHALDRVRKRKHGRGPGGKKYRRTWRSEVKC